MRGDGGEAVRALRSLRPGLHHGKRRVRLVGRGNVRVFVPTRFRFRLLRVFVSDGIRRSDVRLAIPRPVEQTQGMAMVIGRNNAGLGGFDRIRGFSMRPGVNEETIVVSNVEPGDLPDDAAGLSPYELIVWAANDQRFLPSSIDNKPSIEAALRGWLERGGGCLCAKTTRERERERPRRLPRRSAPRRPCARPLLRARAGAH